MSKPTKEGRASAPTTWPQIIDEDVARALGSALRQKIVWILNERVASPSDVAKQLGESLNRICHHMKVLEDARCIELAYERTVGNRIQHFYRATARAFLEDATWPRVPANVQVGMRANLLQTIADDAVEAVVEGVYDEVLAHMSWTPLVVDSEAQVKAYRILERALHEIMDLREPARERLAANGESGIPYTVSILSYRSVAREERTGKGPDD